MADNKKWFKVWTSILIDPDFDELDNMTVGVWLRLGALVAFQGKTGKMILPKNQFMKRTGLEKCPESVTQATVTSLKNVNVFVTENGNDNVTIEFKKWSKYQAFSESYDRVKKFREIKKRNALVTGEEDKIRLDKKRVYKKKFIKPTLEEVTLYCKERKNTVKPEKWIAHYEANGWRVGKNPMQDWKAAVRTWELNEEIKKGAVICAYDSKKPCYFDCPGCNYGKKEGK